MMTKQQAWERWPEHDGHNIGASLGDVVCATCNYKVLERDTQPPGPTDSERVAPFWSS